MKKHIKLILCCLLLTTAWVNAMPNGVANSKVQSSLGFEDDDEVPVLIELNPTLMTGRPRGSVTCPLIAYYYTGMVFLWCLDSSLDSLLVSLSSSNGEYYSTNWTPSTGYLSIPFSGNNGLFTLIITVSEDLSYNGEFELS